MIPRPLKSKPFRLNRTGLRAGDSLLAAEVRPQHLRNVHPAVGALIGLQHGVQRPSQGQRAAVQRVDEARRLRAAIDALPEKYRTVITLYHLQGKQYEEIATVLNLPLGTVKTHLFRAKDQLRKALTP